MAANKFATMLHRNTNKIAFNLVYALLEWILIILLLLNSLFSYLIIKFADYFGLKRPCLWCSRLDHMFEPTSFDSSYRSLVCETHALEISKLGYCSNHRKLAESHDMCEDCSSSSQSEFSTKFAFFPWMKQLGVAQQVGENDETSSKCSCCGIGLDSKLCCPDYFLAKPFWSDLDDTHIENLVLEPHVDAKVGCDDYSFDNTSDFVIDYCEEDHRFGRSDDLQFQNKEVETEQNSVSTFVGKEDVVNESDKVHTEIHREEEAVEKNGLNMSVDDHIEIVSQVDCAKASSSEIKAKHLEFYIEGDDCHLILMEQPATEKGSCGMHDKREGEICDNEDDFVMEFNKDVAGHNELVMEDRSILEGKTPLLPIPEGDEETDFPETEQNEVAQNECSSVMEMDRKLVVEDFKLVDNSQDTQKPTSDHVQEWPVTDIVEEFPPTTDVQEAPELNVVRECLLKDDVEELSVTGDVQESPATDVREISATDYVQEIPGADCVQEGSAMAEQEVNMDNQAMSEEEEEENHEHNDDTEAEISIGTEIPDQEPIDDPHSEETPPFVCMQEESPACESAASSDLGAMQAEEGALEFRVARVETSEENEIDEDKFPDTPTSIDSFHLIHKNLLLLERKESSTEESLDGSIISDIDASDGVLTMEKLKTALRAERKALNTLYAELEEERSASAIAANQTMAMINRLQEEKAAMQMEALQYQRMMEEQAEYDQEALQLLNELMVKREKEKAELEKELEIYRKKVHDYEMEKKIAMLNRRKESSTRSETTSPSFSNAEDSDGVSVDLNHERNEQDYDDQESSNQNTPAAAVLYLEESITTFEDERVSILEQLKVLEEKLCLLSDEEDGHFEDIKPIELLSEENGNGYYDNIDHDSQSNGITNGHFNFKEINGKYHQERRIMGAKAKRLLPLFDAADTEFEDAELDKNYEIDYRKLAIEEEVDHVYERLQALEADREFLKHCITSLRKGDKGVELLQEILHHLRDLRSVELRAKNIGDSSA